ncbi:DsbA family oxidoreductase [Pontiellaceae bacterium B12219]|nr:DsbA family oxidoreductase [Pontiellaceae bacterium B12219]
MKNTLKVDIVSDVACPWCIVGYLRLQQAITETGLQGRVDIEWHPFEINPDMPPEGEELNAHIARKYGSTPEECRHFRAQLTQLGTELSFAFDYYDGMKVVNTRDAHILLEYAQEQGKQTALIQRLFAALFSERKDISNRQILEQEAASVGLNVDEVMAELENAAARQRVQDKEAFWINQGVSGVPTVIFNQTSALTGAQPVEFYKQVLEELTNDL